MNAVRPRAMQAPMAGWLMVGVLLAMPAWADPDPAPSKGSAVRERQPRPVNKDRKEPQRLPKPADEPEIRRDAEEGIPPPERRSGESPRGGLPESRTPPIRAG